MPFYNRRPTRIPGYDYSIPNYYFVTICTYEKRCLFGTVEYLNIFGEIAKNDLLELPLHFRNVEIDNYIVMPNHIHAIIKLLDTKGEKKNLNTILGLYKSGVTRKIHKINANTIVWQRSYYDHIIRNQKEYEQIWSYVQYNDQKWTEDQFYILE